MQTLARDPNIYEKVAKSIAPQISGDYTTDIKRALACLLFGGSRKVLPDGLRLRGDINILLMGDPVNTPNLSRMLVILLGFQIITIRTYYLSLFS